MSTIFQPLILTEYQINFVGLTLKNFSKRIEKINDVNYAPFAYMNERYEVYTISVIGEHVYIKDEGPAIMKTIGRNYIFTLPKDKSLFTTHTKEFIYANDFVIISTSRFMYEQEVIETIDVDDVDDEPLNLIKERTKEVIIIEESQDEEMKIEPHQYALDERELDAVLFANGINAHNIDETCKCKEILTSYLTINLFLTSNSELPRNI